MQKIKRSVFLFVIVSLLATVSAFCSGRILSGGEEGLSIFNKINLDSQVSLWQSNGTGYPMPVYVTRVAPLLLVKILSFLGLPLFLAQALFYFIFVLSGILGAFFLTNGLVKKRSVALFASLFYLLNLYSLTQVFGRFLYSGIVAWSFLPISLFLWFRWLKTSRIHWIFLFGILSIFFSVAYLQPANVITLWAPLILLSAYLAFANRKTPRLVLKILSSSLFGLIIWAIFNIWWIYPYVRIGSESFSAVSDWKSNFPSLLGVSQYFGSEQILLLRQSFLLGKDSLLFDFYSQGWVWIISVFILFVVFIGAFSARKIKSWWFLFILFLVSWFVSKGANPPFGDKFFEFLFKNFPVSQILRNPYEKFGIVWLLAYSVFFGLGIERISEEILPRVKNLIVFVLLFLSCVMLTWPMWTGDVFPPYLKVTIPGYYSGADSFLNSKKDDGRILMLPIIPGDSVNYKWGYRGIEPSEFLFGRSSISKTLRARYFDEKYMDLYSKFVSGVDYNNLLTEMNIRYLVLNDDLLPEASGASSSAQVRDTLKQNNKISFLRQAGGLEIYEFLGNSSGSTFISEAKNPPKITYRKLGPSHYLVSIRDVKESFNLIFKETYNDFWEAKIDKKKLKNHELVYDYANLWRIDKTGDYDIDIVFKVWLWE